MTAEPVTVALAPSVWRHLLVLRATAFGAQAAAAASVRASNAATARSEKAITRAGNRILDEQDRAGWDVVVDLDRGEAWITPPTDGAASGG